MIFIVSKQIFTRLDAINQGASTSKNETSPSTKRKWSDSEAMYVLAGVELYGLGKWASIARTFKTKLVGRDPVGIKDKHRNLMKQKDKPEFKLMLEKARKIAETIKKSHSF